MVVVVTIRRTVLNWGAVGGVVESGLLPGLLGWGSYFDTWNVIITFLIHQVIMRCSYATHALDIRWHALDIRWSYAGDALLMRYSIGSIRQKCKQFCIFKGILCVWKKFYEFSYAAHTFLSYVRFSPQELLHILNGRYLNLKCTPFVYQFIIF